MNTIYNRILKSRLDMTEWLIHFTRDKDNKFARDILLDIIKEAALRPGYSIRNTRSDQEERSTIYGGSPVVCFTEQPLFYFSKYVKTRNSSGFVAPYGILVHKHSVYKVGGRPAIYGWYDVEESDKEKRIINEKYMPIEEQYRYVAFNPLDNLDWSHEREWRWKSGNFAFPEYKEINNNINLLTLSYIIGNPQTQQGVHFLVSNKSDIDIVQDHIDFITNQLETKENKTLYEHYLMRWYKRIKKYAKIISLEQVEEATKNGRPELGRFEGWLEYWKAQQAAEQQSSSES